MRKKTKTISSPVGQFVTAPHTKYSYPYPRGFHKKKKQVADSDTPKKLWACGEPAPRRSTCNKYSTVLFQVGIFCLGVWGVPWGPHEFFFFSFRVVVSFLLQRRFTTSYPESHSFKRDVTLSLVVVHVR